MCALLEGSKRWIEIMIGRGPLTTYEAVETNSNRVVIIKALQKNEENAAFLKEMEWRKDCNSNCILQYYGYCEHNDNYWVVIVRVIKAVVYYGRL